MAKKKKAIEIVEETPAEYEELKAELSAAPAGLIASAPFDFAGKHYEPGDAFEIPAGCIREDDGAFVIGGRRERLPVKEAE